MRNRKGYTTQVLTNFTHSNIVYWSDNLGASGSTQVVANNGVTWSNADNQKTRTINFSFLNEETGVVQSGVIQIRNINFGLNNQTTFCSASIMLAGGG